MAGQQLARALALALGMVAAQEAAVVQEESQRVKIGAAKMAAKLTVPKPRLDISYEEVQPIQPSLALHGGLGTGFTHVRFIALAGEGGHRAEPLLGHPGQHDAGNSTIYAARDSSRTELRPGWICSDPISGSRHRGSGSNGPESAFRRDASDQEVDFTNLMQKISL